MMLQASIGRAGAAEARVCASSVALSVTAAVLLVLTLTVGLSAVMPAMAQATDPNLMRRVERLQKELNDLQRYVYRGGSSSTRGGAAGGDAIGTDVAARMQLQINQMQDQLRSMNGRVEEMQHKISVLEQRLDRMAEDLEIRLQRIEDAIAAGGAINPPSGESDTPSGGPAVTPQARALEMAGLPDDASPREQYDFAFELLKKRDFQGASVALEAFLDKNPDDPLAGNAIYWLGETHYVQKDYRAAAKVFLDGYQKYPTGTKAPDNLLKLGMSLAAYGDTDSACKTFKRLLTTFPKAPVRITNSAKSEQKKLNCT